MPSRRTPNRPVLIVLCGATGDLARKKIFPALSQLYDEGALPHGSSIVGVSRREWDDGAFRQFLSEESTVSRGFMQIVQYARVDFEAGVGYESLATMYRSLSRGRDLVVYLPLAPQHTMAVVRALRRHRIIRRGRMKLLLEKPFGTNASTADALNRLLGSCLDERQVYRIDHYLGKSTVQAMMRVHESSPSLRQIISRDTVRSVSVSLLESGGIDGRGASYDGVGAFRDVGQNHMLEVLASLLAEYPKKGGAEAWQKARALVLRDLLPPAQTCEFARRGQYEGYRGEKGVSPRSSTETAFEVVTGFSRGELSGIAVELRGGKRVGQSRSSVRIDFKEVSGLPREIEWVIQPDPHIAIRHRDGSEEFIALPSRRDAYGAILLDALRGERRHFVGRQEICAAWRYADRVVACWDQVPLEVYSDSHPFFPL